MSELKAVSPTGQQLYSMVTSRFQGGSFPWSMVKESGKKAWCDAAAELLLTPDSILAKFGRSAVEAPAAAVADHVGESDFEQWFASYQPQSKGAKQQARDAYAAGMAGQLSGNAGEVDAKDAERYRWLRAVESSLETRDYAKGVYNGPSCYHMVGGVRELKWGSSLDVAIDAAIAASKGANHG